MALKEQLDAIRAAASKQIPADKLAIMHAVTADQQASGLAERALGVGATLPAFELDNHRGETNDQIQTLGGTLVAISPSTRENAVAIAEKADLSFDILSDPGNGYAEQLGLRCALSDDLREVYSGFGIDLPKYNGDPSWTLPIPARFVADTGGIIRYAEADADYTTRPEPDEALSVLRALSG